jgi:nucleotide-binding universal stress UspA family protein
MTASTGVVPDLTTCYAQVLLPVDFSALSWRSLPIATAMARAFGVPCRVVHVDTSSPWLDAPARVLALNAGPGARSVQVEVVAARSAAAGIVRMLGDDESSLLVMSSHGHTAAAELAMASTAEEVLRTWRGPVLVNGPRSRLAHPLVSRIVVATPPSMHVPVALANDVRAWAERFGAAIELLTVADEATGIPYDFEAERARVARLTEVAELLGARPVKVEGQRAAHEIVNYANACPGTLIAMAPRVKPIARQLFLGSVSKAVLRHSKGPVLFRHA